MNYDLGEATVKGTQIKMVMRGDTLVYNAAAFQLAEGSMLDNLVRALPGVKLEDGGRITVNGEYVSSLTYIKPIMATLTMIIQKSRPLKFQPFLSNQRMVQKPIITSSAPAQTPTILSSTPKVRAISKEAPTAMVQTAQAGLAQALLLSPNITTIAKIILIF